MDSSNLSVILAPNLLHSGDGTEKMNAHTEKRLRLQAAVVQCFIENSLRFGKLKSISSKLSLCFSVALKHSNVSVFVCDRCVASVPSGKGSSHDGL